MSERRAEMWDDTVRWKKGEKELCVDCTTVIGWTVWMNDRVWATHSQKHEPAKIPRRHDLNQSRTVPGAPTSASEDTRIWWFTGSKAAEGDRLLDRGFSSSKRLNDHSWNQTGSQTHIYLNQVLLGQETHCRWGVGFIEQPNGLQNQMEMEDRGEAGGN